MKFISTYFFSVCILLLSSLASAEELLKSNLDIETLQKLHNKQVLQGRWLSGLSVEQKRRGPKFTARWEKNTERRLQTVRFALPLSEVENADQLMQERGFKLTLKLPYTQREQQRVTVIWTEADSNRARFAKDLQVDQALKSFLERRRALSLSVVVLAKGKMLFSRGYGGGGNGARISSMQSYPLGGVSQAITGVLAARLEQDQSIGADTPINLSLDWRTADLLTDLPSNHQHTVKNLLTHTACLSNTVTSAGSDTAQAYYDRVARNGLLSSCKVGEGQQYSLSSLALVHRFLSTMSGRTVAELATELLIEPLGLSSLSLMHTGHYPGAQWRANAHDLARVSQALLDGDLLNKRQLNSRLWSASDGSEYGLGWALAGSRFAAQADDRPNSGHRLLVDRKRNVVIAILSDAPMSQQAMSELVLTVHGLVTQ